MKKIKPIFLLTLASILLCSAKKQPTKSELIREKVAEKVAAYRKTVLEKCTSEVMELAGELVDSTLIARARLQVKDMVPKPEIPFRPDRPEVKLPKDTAAVIPIFSEKDSLPLEKPKLPFFIKKIKKDTMTIEQ